MKLLVVGAGSIGSRYARIAGGLAGVYIHDTDNARARGTAASSGAVACYSLDEALKYKPEAAIVATPHIDHVETALTLMEAGCHVLVEKPVSDRLDTARHLVDRASATGRRLFVACNMRFHPGPATLRAHIGEIGTPLFARAHFGQWLPDMRPHADYRKVYSARREAGGGVILDAIHEIDYLTWLFGPVVTVAGTSARLSDLEIDVEDYAAVNMQHGNGVRSEIHLDYLQSCKRRGCEIAGTGGTLVWESEGKAPEYCLVRLYRRDPGNWKTLYESDEVDPDAMYRELLARFLAAARGESAADLLDGGTAREELAVALAVKNHPAQGESPAGGSG